MLIYIIFTFLFFRKPKLMMMMMTKNQKRNRKLHIQQLTKVKNIGRYYMFFYKSICHASDGFIILFLAI